MKNIKIFFLATVAIVAGLFTACNDSDFEAGPAADGAQVYFPDYTPTMYSISDDVTSIAIPVKRIAKDAAMTVAILPAEESGLFTIPTSVSFAAGSDAAELLITFDRSALEDGKEYPIALLINDEDNTTTYGYRTLNFTVAPWPWEQMKGTGLFRDDWFTAMYNGGNPEIEVTVHKHKSKEGIYMIEEMYGWLFLTEFFGASQAAIEAQIGTYRSTNITIDCSDPAKVLIPRQFTGITDLDADYGDYEIATFTGGEGTLVNGVITFPKEGLALACKAGVLNANKSGLFRIVLPGFEVVDYTLAAAYGGMKVGPDGETTSAIVDFAYGADVTGISYVFAPGNVTGTANEIAAAIVAGTVENVYEVKNLTVGGKNVSVEAELSAAGVYTIVALPKDKEGKLLASEVSAASFYFPGMNGGAIPDCDATAELMLVSDYNPTLTERFPDHSSIACVISGTELASVKYYLNTTDLIAMVEAGELDMSLQDIMDAYSTPLSAAQLQGIETNGYWGGVFSELDPDTSFTLVIDAANIYGKKVLVKSNPLTTAVAPASNGLAVGKQNRSSYHVDSKSLLKKYFRTTAADFTMKSLTFDHGVRTLSVKTAQCEPLPKQIGRISIKENADRNLR